MASRSGPTYYVHIVLRVCHNQRELLFVSLTFCADIKAKWIGDSQRAIERGESLARAELERQLEAEMQSKSTTESQQEVASTTEKTV